MEARGQAWLLNMHSFLSDVLSYSVSTMGPTMVRPGEKIFKFMALRRLENATLKFDLAYTAFHLRAILLIFEAEFTESVLRIPRIQSVLYGPPWLDPKKNK